MLSLCFDDFPRTAWTEGGRVLRDHGVRATYYLAGGLAGSVFEGQPMFVTEDLEAIHAEGHELGCHTFDHRSCLRRSRHDLVRSLEANRRFVRERVGDVHLVSFAYPYGDTTIGTKHLAARSFASARGVNPGLNRGSLDLAQLKAIGLEARRRQAADIEPWIAEASARGAWLVVFTHDVQDKPSDYGCLPADLDRLIRAARSAGLEILPVKAALGARAFACP
jgi:peptidoglycan/xylan/chitin deacetylase (PgdA/CDA1 family)